MDKNYFKLKYLIMDTFYTTWLNEDHQIGEAAGITYYSILGGTKSKNNLETVITRSTVIQLCLRHGGKITDYDKRNIKDLIDLNSGVEAKSKLTEDEFEYFEEDISFLLSLYEQLKELE